MMASTKRPARTSEAWTSAEDRRLGKDTDEAIAKELGRAVRSVAVRRWSMGIKPFRPQGKPPKDPETALGQFIRNSRGRTSIEAMAKKAKITPKSWQQIEMTNRPRLSAATLQKVAKALGVDVKKLLELC